MAMSFRKIKYYQIRYVKNLKLVHTRMELADLHKVVAAANANESTESSKTNRPSQKNAQYETPVRQGDLLLNIVEQRTEIEPSIEPLLFCGVLTV